MELSKATRYSKIEWSKWNSKISSLKFYEINNHSNQYLDIFAFFLKVFYAPHPGRFPGEHSLNAAGHSNGLPKEARLTTVTTVLENLRKFSNYTLQVLSFTDAGDGQLSKIISCATHSDGKIVYILKWCSFSG